MRVTIIDRHLFELIRKALCILPIPTLLVLSSALLDQTAFMLLALQLLGVTQVIGGLLQGGQATLHAYIVICINTYTAKESAYIIKIYIFQAQAYIII